jgi:hypothetical protein
LARPIHLVLVLVQESVQDLALVSAMVPALALAKVPVLALELTLVQNNR